MKEALISKLLENGHKATVTDSTRKIEIRVGLGAIFVLLKEKGKTDKCLMAPLQKTVVQNAQKAAILADELIATAEASGAHE